MNLRKIRTLGIAINRGVKVFDNEYCKDLGNRLLKTPAEWVQIQATRVPNDSKVLEIRVGSHDYREHFTHCRYVLEELMKSSDFVSRQVDTSGDMCPIPFKEGSFDVVLCSEVFTHILHPIGALREIQRILKPGGKLIMTAALGSGQRKKPLNFYGGYTRCWYERVFPEVGFEIEDLDPCGGQFACLVDLLWKGYGVLSMIRQQGLLGKAIGPLVQFFLFNIPSVVFSEFDKQMLLEEFTAGYLCVARKVNTGYRVRCKMMSKTVNTNEE